MKYQFFLGQSWCWAKKQSFSWEKVGFGWKSQLFLGKTKETKNKSFGKLYGHTQKNVFFWFSLGNSFPKYVFFVLFFWFSLGKS